MPGIGDIPRRVESVILEIPDPNGPWGVRGMAEKPFIPPAPAVSAAIYDAVGVWFDDCHSLPSTSQPGCRSLNGTVGATAPEALGNSRRLNPLGDPPRR